jgi:hypothetical protein
MEKSDDPVVVLVLGLPLQHEQEYWRYNPGCRKTSPLPCMVQLYRNRIVHKSTRSAIVPGVHVHKIRRPKHTGAFDHGDRASLAVCILLSCVLVRLLAS